MRENKTYILNGEVTVSVYTEVVASSKEEAEEIAYGRDVEQSRWGDFGQKKRVWVSDEFDGSIENIETNVKTH